MSIKKELRIIKDLYDHGENIMQYLKDSKNIDHNTNEFIQTSYDMQAGSYIDYVEGHKEFWEKYTSAFAQVLNKYPSNTILEVGVGEATTLVHTMRKLKNSSMQIYGFDISWSRIKMGKEYTEKHQLKNVSLFVADLFHIPIKDNAIDLVYTSHSLEPNGGREKEALKELYRVTNKYLVLLEPAYELADKKAQEAMKQKGYVTNLTEAAKKLKYKIIEHRLFEYSANPMNPSGVIIIEKNAKGVAVKHPMACPITGAELKFQNDSYFCKESMLAYPVIQGIGCLQPENAIIASRYLDN